MAVDFDAFVAWAEDRFDGNVIVKGKNVLLCSIFAEDHKHHLSCCPSGGAKKREWGVYRCYYSETRGTLLGLVMQVDQCGPEEAKDILRGRVPFHLLEEEVEKYFNGTLEDPAPPAKVELPPEGIRLPESTFLIKDMPEESSERQRAIDYLVGRKMPWDGMYFCTDGDYWDRIIIPYYDPAGKLVYWNGRSMGKSKLRYRGPPKEWGIGKGDVLFCWGEWPRDGETIYLTEGEFDAIALTLSGHPGIACGGKSVSEAQVEMLRRYKVCLCLDQDNAGLHGLVWIGDTLLKAGINNLSFVRPAKGFKDWNAMLEKFGPEVVGAYVDKYVKPYDSWTGEQLLAAALL